LIFVERFFYQAFHHQTKVYIAPQNILESERVLIQRYNIQKEQAVQRVDEFPKEKH